MGLWNRYLAKREAKKPWRVQGNHVNAKILCNTFVECGKNGVLMKSPLNIIPNDSTGLMSNVGINARDIRLDNISQLPESWKYEPSEGIIRLIREDVKPEDFTRDMLFGFLKELDAMKPAIAIPFFAGLAKVPADIARRCKVFTAMESTKPFYEFLIENASEAIFGKAGEFEHLFPVLKASAPFEYTQHTPQDGGKICYDGQLFMTDALIGLEDVSAKVGSNRIDKKAYGSFPWDILAQTTSVGTPSGIPPYVDISSLTFRTRDESEIEFIAKKSRSTLTIRGNGLSSEIRATNIDEDYARIKQLEEVATWFCENATEDKLVVWATS